MGNFKSAAVLVWMPVNEVPSIATFEKEHEVDMPETRGFWELGAALAMARLPHESGKVAWIKVNEKLLTPDECLQAYERFKVGEEF